MTTVPSVQMTQTPLKLHVIKILSNYSKNYDLKSVGVVYVGICEWHFHKVY